MFYLEIYGSIVEAISKYYWGESVIFPISFKLNRGENGKYNK
jgi:hypothetical protein